MKEELKYMLIMETLNEVEHGSYWSLESGTEEENWMIFLVRDKEGEERMRIPAKLALGMFREKIRFEE